MKFLCLIFAEKVMEQMPEADAEKHFEEYREFTDGAFVARAVGAGAKITMPLDNMFWGEGYCKLEDPFGHHWSVATHVRDVSSEEMQQAMKSMGG